MTTVTDLSSKARKLWIGCLLTSLVLHFVVCAYLYFFPPRVTSPLYSLFGLSTPDAKSFPEPDNLDLIDKNDWIAEAFETILIMPKETAVPHDLQQVPEALALAPEPEVVSDSSLPTNLVADFSSLIDDNTLTKEAIIKQIDEVMPSPLFQALEEKAKIASTLQIDDTLPSIELPFSLPESLNEYEEALTLSAAPELPSPEANPSSAVAPQQEPPALTASLAPSPVPSPVTTTTPPVVQEHKTTLFIPSAKPTPSLPPRSIDIPVAVDTTDTYTLPHLPQKALWNDDFSVDLTFAQDPSGAGYFFSLILTPQQDLAAHQLKQNFHFLLDHTASSHKHRFSVFKKAVLKALNSLSADDCFNITILDKEPQTFNKRSLPATLHNKRLAEEFIEKQSAPFLIATGNVYKLLPSVLSTIGDDDEAHTAILLTDGLASSDPQKQRKLCQQWILANRGKVNLYAAAVGDDNNLLLLDLLSSQSGGKLLYSDTHAAFPRKVAKLVLDLKAPLAKEISITAKAKDPQTHIELYPASSTLPLLYANEPYVIYGKIDRPTSFELLLQGRHKEDWIGIKKTISFKEAHPMPTQSMKKLRRTQASVFYNRFLTEGKLSSFNQAKTLFNQYQRELTQQ